MIDGSLIGLWSLAVIVPGIALLAVLWLRFAHLRPSAVAFADSRSAELWRELAQSLPLLVLTESLTRAMRENLSPGRKTLKADAPRVVVHFSCDSHATVPVIWLLEAGPGFLMEVAYKDKLAKVILAVIADLRPICAISVGRQKPAHPTTLWPRLLFKLDGPPWFVLCSLLANKRWVERLHRSTAHAEAPRQEHAST
ncbi:MAG: hypothetical protein ACRD7E_06560 [Bryobacteraceae bacterium]